MQSIKKFLLQHSHFYSLLLLIPLYIWFECCERNIVPKYLMHTPLDDKIPFVKLFVIPYVIWFFYVAYGLIYTGMVSKKEYYKLFIFLAGGMTVCYILFMLFPSGQDLRPVITQNDIFSNTIKYLYKTDTSTNVCPSIHVFNSIAVDSALRNSSAFNRKKGAREISFVLTTLICLSTLFIKQHSIIDFVCGFVLAVIFYLPIYAIPNIKQQKSDYKSYKFSELFRIAMNS